MKTSLPKKSTASSLLSQYTLEDKKLAKDIAIAELISSLKKLKTGQSLRFGDLGTFAKSQHQYTSTLKGNKSYGKTYLYYRLNFRASSFLKEELDK